MPITKDRFDRIGGEDGQLEDDANRILDFLIQNDEKAYKKREIAEETGVEMDRVGPALDRLRERTSVQRKSDYWRVTDHELAVRAATALTTETARQQDGGESFDVEKWRKYAVDEADLNRGENE
jgi:DNA-binding transcriptional MocR family regulator